MTYRNIILGIESSCDDTSAAIVADGICLSNKTANQAIHEKYGGVVPELASRAHQANILPVVDIALREARLELKDVTAIAYTRGPGLMGSLLVGSSFAHGLHLATGVPLYEINHMQAHILAHFIQEKNEEKVLPTFPFLCLTVSGGHTQIIRVNSYFEMDILGETKDDAAGEAFDKIGKIMNLPYPAGPYIDSLAQHGDENAFDLPIADMQSLNFSFSGLKTAFLYLVQREIKKNPNFIEENKTNLAASAQKAIVSALIRKLKKASKTSGIKEIAIAGGVSANSGLRQALLTHAEKLNWKVFIPPCAYCTDNAAMSAMTGYLKKLENHPTDEYKAPAARMVF